MRKLNLIIILSAVLILPLKSYPQSHDFELSDIYGNSVKLSQLMEKGPVMLQFWALWCIPCKEEMKILSQLYAKYKDSGYVYVAINQDSPKSSAKVKSYIESKSYKFTVLLDPDLHVLDDFGGQNLPFSVFLDMKGNIIQTYTGYIPGDESKIEEVIIKALAESKSGKN